MRRLLDQLRKEVLLCDGAMGTELQKAGLEVGECGEAWVLERREEVLAIHRAYLRAGADCLITNTFGGSSIALRRHGLGNRVREINLKAVELARLAWGEREGFVLGDIGPFGGLMEPFGEFSREEVYDSFSEQAEALVEGGVDALIIETQTSLEELETVIEAARKAGPPCLIASVSFDVVREGADLRTMMGVSPEEVVDQMEDWGVDVVGTNCGKGVDIRRAVQILKKYRKHSALPLLAQPNAGSPVMERGRVVYREKPEEMAAGLDDLLAAGARVVGSCCGSTPEHTRALALRLRHLQSSGFSSDVTGDR